MKDVLVIGNWKLHGNRSFAINLGNELKNLLKKNSRCQVIIAPPVVYLDVVRNCLVDSNIQLCSQNVDIHLSGSFTGEISAEMLKDLNVRYVLIGHSERRMYHKENDECIAKKFFIVKKMGLIPILCIGENKREHQAGHTQMVCITQINAVIQLLGIQALEDSIIAYEPVWAIGSGISANPETVQLTHKFIRDYIAEYNVSIAEKILIQYGGSITPDNVVDFFCQKDIDGVLVGAVSLKMDDFFKIIQVAEKFAIYGLL